MKRVTQVLKHSEVGLLWMGILYSPYFKVAMSVNSVSSICNTVNMRSATKQKFPLKLQGSVAHIHN